MAVPVTGPEIAMVLAFCSVVAVVAFPDKAPLNVVAVTVVKFPRFKVVPVPIEVEKKLAFV